MTISLRKLLKFCDATARFPQKCHYPADLVNVTSQCVISMECLHSFLTCHFIGKPVVASRNVGSFLRLHFHFLCSIFVILHHLLIYITKRGMNDLKPIHLRTLKSDFLWLFTFLNNWINWQACYFSPGLLKMLSFGFQKLKIFLLLKTLERFVKGCHLNLILYMIATCLGIYDCFFFIIIISYLLWI